MAKQVIDLGTADNPNTGDSLRAGGDKINDNFTELYDADTAQDTAIALNTAKNSYPSADATKLSNIEDNATIDQSDAEIETAYNNQVAVVSQVDAEAGTSTTAERWTPERVKQAIDALGGGGGGAVTPLFKTVDETKNNDAARVLDTDLQAELDASSSYRFEVLLRVIGSNIQLAACEFQIPSGATGEYVHLPSGTNRVHIDLTNVFNAGNNFGNTEYCYVSGVIITTNAGTFGIKWAQDSSSAENVTIQKGSNILLTKLN